ncbi:GTP pyrophosphokinase [Cryobacterium sp. W22_MBD10_FK3]|uniref:GTP pyrophosphokinase n=1 Tax=Cryobacterium sp. W22_MBD10_FK3 TaxID=3240273 RepID=UPI003F91227B
MPDIGVEPILPTYAQFAAWHAQANQRFLEPARSAAERVLSELLDSKVDPIDRGRFRISTSRVKTAQRAFAKLSQERYAAEFTENERIPEIIDDLVGLRLVCNNLSDINTFQEIIGELPLDDGARTSLAVESESQRDYFSNPKPSGYRAFHVNFVVPVAQAHETKRVRVEVQARTLLQDGWGELTHEDTYKPGSKVPDWIVGMSLRMAELLAAVDNIAQDLRTGLDVETQRSVDEDTSASDIAFIETGQTTIALAVPSFETKSGTPEDRIATNVEVAPAYSELQTALIREAKRLIEDLRHPIGLAALSQSLASKFGTNVTQTWADFGGFKMLLQVAVPEVVLTGPSPGYVHPLGSTPSAEWIDTTLTADEADGVPTFLKSLRTYDKALPLISSERMTQVIETVVEVVLSQGSPQIDRGRVSQLALDELAKQARSFAERQGRLVVRPHALYVLMVLNRHDRINSELNVVDAKRVLGGSVLQSAIKNGLIEEENEAAQEIKAWLQI